MMNTVSLNTIRVTRFATMAVAAAFAIAFFAFPLVSFAKMGGCGGGKNNTVKETFVGLASSTKTDPNTGAVLTFTPAINGPITSGDWIVSKDKSGMLWAATLTAKIQNGTAKALTVAINGKSGSTIQVTNIPSSFSTSTVASTLITPATSAPSTPGAAGTVATGWMTAK